MTGTWPRAALWPVRLRRLLGPCLVGLGLATGVLLLAAEAQQWHRLFVRAEQRTNVLPDAFHYYAAASSVVQGRGARLYDLDEMASAQRALHSAWWKEETPQGQVRTLPFLNPPFVALLFVPLALLPLEQALAVWGLVTWALAVGLAGGCAAVAGGRVWWQRALWLLGVMTFLPAFLAIMQGQLSLILALAALAGWLLLCRGRGLWGGLVLAALLVKPQYAALVPVALLLRHQWRALAGFGLGAASAGVLSLLAVGTEGALAYLRLLPDMGRLGPGYAIVPEWSHSWSGFFVRLLGEGDGATVSWVVFSALTALLVARLWWAPGHPVKPRERDAAADARFAALLVGTVLVSPHTYVHDLALLAPAAALGWRSLHHVARPTWTSLGWVILAMASWAGFWGVTFAGPGPVAELTVPLAVSLASLGLAILAWATVARPGHLLASSRSRS